MKIASAGRRSVSDVSPTKCRKRAPDRLCSRYLRGCWTRLERLTYAQLASQPVHQNRVLAEQHTHQLSTESIRPQRSERFIAIARASSLIGGGDCTSSAGFHDSQCDLARVQLVNTVFRISAHPIDDDVRSETIH